MIYATEKNFKMHQKQGTSKGLLKDNKTKVWTPQRQGVDSLASQRREDSDIPRVQLSD